MRACTPFMSTIRTTNRRWRPSSRRHFQYRLSRYPVPGQSERLQVRHLHHRSRNVTACGPGFNPAGAAQYWIRWRDAKRTDYHQGVAYETQPLLKEKCIIYQRNVNSTPSSVSLLSSKYFL